MFGEGEISSSKSPATSGSSPDPSPDPDRAVPETFFSFRELWPGEGSLPVGRSLFRPQETEAIQGSLADIACEGGGAHGSTIMQSRAGTGDTCATSALPLSGVLARSGVLLLFGVLIFSGVRDHPDALP